MLDQVTRGKPRIFLEQKMYWNHLECLKEHELSSSPVFFFPILIYSATGGNFCVLKNIPSGSNVEPFPNPKATNCLGHILFVKGTEFYTPRQMQVTQCISMYKATALDASS